ncbi:bifunctional metallophosphatase/5'-nucleotidase [Bradyrhizobium sp.]|uniref:bifunctional metallophosphatase/5'-nucleotidase n=1 Tax=Bradyrhizobium sp. TaxID=376 RepID=UPI002E087D0D|nr:metallophosphoesterase [Bradyrhizobium sp.]
MDGVADGKKGGLHRLQTLLKWIRRDAPEAILLHAGDFLAPSLISKAFKGEQMIEAMNLLNDDGKPDRMFVVFGNHEFDDSKCDDKNPPPLNALVATSHFTWLNSNLDFSDCTSMKSLSGDARVAKEGFILQVNGVKLGLFGIGLTPDQMEGKPSRGKFPVFQDEVEAARKSIEYLRNKGAEFIVGVTHLSRADDQNLVNTLASKGLDLLVGGHDHSNMVLMDSKQNARGFKADSDARTVWRIDVDLTSPGKPVIRPQLIALNEAIPADAALDKLAQSWTVRAETYICEKFRDSKRPNCLTDEVGWTKTPVDLDETANRTEETGFGAWLADLLAEKTGADVAIINSGSLGLDEELAAGTRIQVRQIVEMFRYDDVVAVRSFPASRVCESLRHAFGSPGAGAWPHVSGVEVDIQLPQQTGNAVTVRNFVKRPRLSCESSELVKVASVPFVLCGNDGYTFKPPDQIPPGKTCEAVLPDNPLNDKSEPKRLSRMTEDAIYEVRVQGIEPKKKGRIRFVKAKPEK